MDVNLVRTLPEFANRGLLKEANSVLFEKGRHLVLYGPSGCGKSGMIQVLCENLPTTVNYSRLRPVQLEAGKLFESLWVHSEEPRKELKFSEVLHKHKSMPKANLLVLDQAEKLSDEDWETLLDQNLKSIRILVATSKRVTHFEKVPLLIRQLSLEPVSRSCFEFYLTEYGYALTEMGSPLQGLSSLHSELYELTASHPALLGLFMEEALGKKVSPKALLEKDSSFLNRREQYLEKLFEDLGISKDGLRALSGIPFPISLNSLVLLSEKLQIADLIEALKAAFLFQLESTEHVDCHPLLEMLLGEHCGSDSQFDQKLIRHLEGSSDAVDQSWLFFQGGGKSPVKKEIEDLNLVQRAILLKTVMKNKDFEGIKGTALEGLLAQAGERMASDDSERFGSAEIFKLVSTYRASEIEEDEDKIFSNAQDLLNAYTKNPENFELHKLAISILMSREQWNRAFELIGVFGRMAQASDSDSLYGDFHFMRGCFEQIRGTSSQAKHHFRSAYFLKESVNDQMLTLSLAVQSSLEEHQSEPPIRWIDQIEETARSSGNLFYHCLSIYFRMVQSAIEGSLDSYQSFLDMISQEQFEEISQREVLLFFGGYLYQKIHDPWSITGFDLDLRLYPHDLLSMVSRNHFKKLEQKFCYCANRNGEWRTLSSEAVEAEYERQSNYEIFFDYAREYFWEREKGAPGIEKSRVSQHIFLILAFNPGRRFSLKELYEAVYQKEYNEELDEPTIRMAVIRLKKKLDPSKDQYIAQGISDGKFYLKAQTRFCLILPDSEISHYRDVIQKLELEIQDD